MLFNSIDFAIFLPIVFIIYWFVVQKNLKIQNLFLLLASYLFYGWWDWRFLFLLLFSTMVDYTVYAKLKKGTIAGLVVSAVLNGSNIELRVASTNGVKVIAVREVVRAV